MNYITLNNGDIKFHKKNSTPPPDFSSVYDRDTLDPWLFHPRFPSCTKLEYKNQMTKCKKIYGVWWCKKKEETTTVPLCNKCEVREPDLLQVEIKAQPNPTVPLEEGK